MCNFLEGHSAYLVALHLVRMRTEIWHPFLPSGFSGLISVTRILSSMFGTRKSVVYSRKLHIFATHSLMHKIEHIV